MNVSYDREWESTRKLGKVGQSAIIKRSSANHYPKICHIYPTNATNCTCNFDSDNCHYPSAVITRNPSECSAYQTLPRLRRTDWLTARGSFQGWSATIRLVHWKRKPNKARETRAINSGFCGGWTRASLSKNELCLVGTLSELQTAPKILVKRPSVGV